MALDAAGELTDEDVDAAGVAYVRRMEASEPLSPEQIEALEEHRAAIRYGIWTIRVLIDAGQDTETADNRASEAGQGGQVA